MKSLICFEFRKLLSRKSFIILFFICSFIVVSFSFANTNSKVQYEHHEQYLNLISTDSPASSTYAKLLSLYEEQKTKLELGNTETSSQRKEEADTYQDVSKEDYFELTTVALKYVENIMKYEKYNQNIQSNADSKIANRYGQIEKSNVKVTNHLTFDAMNDQIFILIGIIILSVYAILILKNYERDTKTDSFIFLCKKGKRDLILAKYLTTVLVAVSLVLFFYLTIFSLYAMKYGIGDITLNIQSLSSCYESALNSTILSGLMIGCIKSIVLIIMFLNVFYILVYLTKSESISLLAFFVFLLIEYILYMSIDIHSHYHVLKKMNIFQLFSFFSIINKNSLISIFSVYLDSLLLLTISFLLLQILVIITIVNYGQKWNLGFSKELALSFPSKGKHVNLFKHETYKQLVIGKGVVVLVVVIAFSLYTFVNTNTTFHNQNFSTVLNQYEKYGGSLSEKKIQKIEEKQEEIDTINREFIHSYELHSKGELSDLDFAEKETEYLNSLSAHEGFKAFYLDYLNRAGNVICFPNGYNALFGINTTQRDIVHASFIVLVLILLVSGIYTIDKNHDQQLLYNLTKNGKEKRLNNQRIISYIYVIGAFIVLFLINSFIFMLKYPLQDITLPLSSIMRLYNIDKVSEFFLHESLLVYFASLLFTRFVALLILRNVVLALTSLLSSRKNVILFLVFFTVMSFILVEIGITELRFISFIHLVGGNPALHQSDGWIFVHLLLLLAVTQFLSKKQSSKLLA